MANVKIYRCDFCRTYFSNSSLCRFNGLTYEAAEDKVDELRRGHVHAEIVRDNQTRRCNGTQCRAITNEVGTGQSRNFKTPPKRIPDRNAWGS